MTMFQQPVTKNVLTAAEFIKAAKGEPFEQREWFFKKTGKELNQDLFFRREFLYLDHNREYIVLKETQCGFSGGAREILLEDIGKEGFQPAFLFYKCVLPTISLMNSIAGDFLFNHTHITRLELDDKSRCGSITVFGNSRCDKIVLANNSYAAGICIDNSRNESIEIWKDSGTGFLTIYKDSRVDYVHITGNSFTGDIYITDSQIDNLLIDDSQTGSLNLENSRIKYVTVKKNCCQINLFNVHLVSMILSDCRLMELNWGSGTKGALYIDGCRINRLTFHRTALPVESLVSVINTQVHIVQLQEFLAVGRLMLRNVTPLEELFGLDPSLLRDLDPSLLRDLEDRDLGDNNLARHLEYEFIAHLEEIEAVFKDAKTPLFRIFDSSPGKMEIIGCDLRAFHFEYRNSNSSEIYTAGTQWPEERESPFKTSNA